MFLILYSKPTRKPLLLGFPIVTSVYIRQSKGVSLNLSGNVVDDSLITGRGGGLQNGKIAGPKVFAPHPLKTG